MNKTNVKINELVYLGLSIQDISMVARNRDWHHCVKMNYGKTAKLCYMDMDGFIAHVKLEDI